MRFPHTCLGSLLALALVALAACAPLPAVPVSPIATPPIATPPIATPPIATPPIATPPVASVAPSQPVPEEPMPSTTLSPPKTIPAATGALRPTAAELAVADLAGQLGIAAEAITVRSVEAVEWSDASLGCPKPGMMYAEVITPGYRIVLEANGQSYEYHAGRSSTIVRCKP